MVALPTPARAAIDSIDSDSTGVPSASRSSAASTIASSARALRGRPGLLRSWSAGAVPDIVVMFDIVTGNLRFGQFQLRECLARLRRRPVGGRAPGQPG